MLWRDWYESLSPSSFVTCNWISNGREPNWLNDTSYPSKRNWASPDFMEANFSMLSRHIVCIFRLIWLTSLVVDTSCEFCFCSFWHQIFFYLPHLSPVVLLEHALLSIVGKLGTFSSWALAELSTRCSWVWWPGSLWAELYTGGLSISNLLIMIPIPRTSSFFKSISWNTSFILWYHKLPEQNQINGTYWMRWKADMCQLKQDIKELKQLRKDIGEFCLDSILQLLYSMGMVVWSFRFWFSMQSLLHILSGGFLCFDLVS